MSIYDASNESATPTTPTTGRVKLYPKSGKFYALNDAGVESVVGQGAVGGGSDTWALEVDQVVTTDWTVGLGAYTTGVSASGTNLTLTGHTFVIGSKVHFIAGSGSLGSVLTTDTVYYVVAISAGVSFQVSLTQGGAAVTPTGASNCSVAKLKNAITGASLDIANGVTVTIPNGTYLTLSS